MGSLWRWILLSVLGVAVLAGVFAGVLGVPNGYVITRWTGRGLLAAGAWFCSRRAFRTSSDTMHTLRMASLLIVALAGGGAYQLGRRSTGECDDHGGCETEPDPAWHVSLGERLVYFEHGLLLMGVPTLLAAFRSPARRGVQADDSP